MIETRDSFLPVSVPTGPLSTRLERARLDILHLRLEEADDLWRAVDSALRISGETLQVARVGIWFLTADQAALYRARLHEPGRTAPSDEAVLPLAHWPRYREAVVSRRVVAAHDARTDATTAELRADYLERVGITSMLDAPLFLTGEVHGIVCHEHIGPARTWSQREIDFATSVADMLSALLEQAMRLSAERRLRGVEADEARAARLGLAARTAAGIAHDVNTVLQAISANAVTAGSATVDERRAEAIASILEDCQRSARILGQLRDLDAPRAVLGDAIAIADVVEGLRPTLEALVGPERQLALHVGERAFVDATRTDVERIVLNLVSNARDAVKAGTITVVVDARDGHAHLAVEDEGPGVPANEAAHVFEPYFSTKDDDRGGLGLFIVQVIAERSGGAVDVENRPGGGARFVVSWPVRT